MFCVCLGTTLPVCVSAQAGSSLPLRFSATDARAAGFVSGHNDTMLPVGVLKLAPEERFLLWANLAQGKLNILEKNDQGGMVLRQVIPISIGKNGFGKEKEGDKKTPVGVYRITSFLSDEQLIDFYGLGAFPLNYPNVLDRMADRTGSGIWLHGLPKNVASRPLLDSDGCVIIDNESFSEINQYITPGITHMILSEGPLLWQGKAQLNDLSSGLAQAFEGWRLAWQTKDNPAFLAYYSEDFNDFKRNKSQWSDYKSRVNNGKSWIQVEASKVSFFADLVNPELVTVRYYQNYKSSNYQWQGWKEQVWQESGQGWQILFEGNG